jgi:hypothetical protein
VGPSGMGEQGDHLMTDDIEPVDLDEVVDETEDVDEEAPDSPKSDPVEEPE